MDRKYRDASLQNIASKQEYLLNEESENNDETCDENFNVDQIIIVDECNENKNVVVHEEDHLFEREIENEEFTLKFEMVEDQLDDEDDKTYDFNEDLHVTKNEYSTEERLQEEFKDDIVTEIIVEEYFDEEIIQEHDSSTISNDVFQEKIIDTEIIEELDSQNNEINLNNDNTQVSSEITENQIFICEVCGTICTSKIKLNKHRKTHGESQFQCNQCLRWFTKRYHLINHMITHTGTVLKLIICKYF